MKGSSTCWHVRVIPAQFPCRRGISMRTRFVSNVVPYPPNNGSNQRVYHLLRGVARASEVTLFCLMESEEQRELANSLREFCREVHFLPREVWGHGAPRKLPKPLIWGRS